MQERAINWDHKNIDPEPSRRKPNLLKGQVRYVHTEESPLGRRLDDINGLLLVGQSYRLLPKHQLTPLFCCKDNNVGKLKKLIPCNSLESGVQYLIDHLEWGFEIMRLTPSMRILRLDGEFWKLFK